MNILIPHHWLLEYLETEATPEQIQKNLSLCGPGVERINLINGEPIYDIEITPNRVDSMSILGIAREAATILPEFNIPAKLISPPWEGEAGRGLPESKQPLGIEIVNDPALCHRILAIKLTNVKLAPSPQWLQDRLLQVDQRPLNNAIDITNYVMWEIGHPLHAFDYDRLVEKKIIVRQAKAGESFTTLDNITYTTKGGEVVFDDGTGTIVDLPGVMGTANSVITDQTQNVLLWIESVVPNKIRFASMQHNIRTQAAVLNEKGVDPELGLPAIHRAIRLFQELVSAQIASELVDIYPTKPEIKTTELTSDQIKTYLGIDIPSDRITRILTNLGCTVKTSPLERGPQPDTIAEGGVLTTNYQANYHLTPPSYRATDLQLPVDYIEEIARIYGYHNLPSTLMPTALPLNKPTDSTFELETKIKTLLTGWGLQEVYTYSLVSEELAKQSGYKIEEHLKLSNPLSDEWLYLRRSHIPSHLQFLTDNRGAGDITIFEIANLYIPQASSSTREGEAGRGLPGSQELPTEQLTLTITTNRNYPHLKGLLDALMQKLFIRATVILSEVTTKNELERNEGPPTGMTQTLWYAPNHATITSNNTTLGSIGQTLTNSYSLELNIKALSQHAKSHPTYQPLSKFSPIIQDFTFQLPPNTYVQPVIDSLLTLPFVANVELISRYQNNISFRIYFQTPDRQLTDTDIQPIRDQITQTLSKQFSAQLR